MNEHGWFSPSIYEEQTRLAEHELAVFLKAVNYMYGPEQARCATEDWLDEAELRDSPPRSTSRNWRSVSIAASARLSSCIGTTSPALHNSPAIYGASANTLVQLDRNSTDRQTAQRFGNADILEFQ